MSRKIADMTVSDVGLGCMGFSHAYGAAMERKEAVRMLRLAYEIGYSFFDTAECYTGHDAAGRESLNEELVGEALRPVRDRVIIATKCGVKHLPGRRQELDSSPAAIRRAVEGSLRRLGVERIDLYYQHRIDPKVEPETVAQTMQELIREGKIRHWGISEVGEEYLRRAHAVCPVAAVQNRFSMLARWYMPLLPTLEELGVALVAFSPLANGALSCDFETTFACPTDYRQGMPQFSPEGVAKNAQLLELLQEIAVQKEATPAQVAMAWMLCKKPYIVPIPGSRKEARLRENFGAGALKLQPEEVAELDTRLTSMELAVYGYRPS